MTSIEEQIIERACRAFREILYQMLNGDIFLNDAIEKVGDVVRHFHDVMENLEKMGGDEDE